LRGAGRATEEFEQQLGLLGREARSFVEHPYDDIVVE
jgi:hypothetical protein